MDKFEKRKRSGNFTTEEKNLLIELVEKYKGILENKKTNAVTQREKDSMWEKVSNIFNSQNLNVPRSAESLKKLWHNQKQEARKAAAQNRQERFKTGGGPATLEATSDLVDKTISIISNKTVTGLGNLFGGDIQDIQDYTTPYQSPIQITSSPLTYQNASTSRTDIVDKEISPQNKWKSRRRPKTKINNNDDQLTNLKIRNVQLQNELLEQEIYYKRKMYELDILIKKQKLNGESAPVSPSLFQNFCNCS